MKYFVYCRKSQEDDDRQVRSIPSQRSELLRTFGAAPDVEIAEIIEEACSAKAPGRPMFKDMLTRVQSGEAEGIISWAPDRLARNSVDGGQIIYLLDTGGLKNLKFATYTFENNPQGKFMLSIMFGQSKYYSDALSENVRRGNRTKIEQGWRPNLAPLGYLNDPATKTIVPDPVHFPLVRRMFELILVEGYSAKEVAIIARDDWGFRTPKRRKIGGTPLAMSSVYAILANPFYAGVIVWGGETYPGKHEQIVTVDEFDQVRRLIDRKARAKPKTYNFPYTGLIQCGECGLAITAEHKINRHGSRYIYYRCSKRRLGPKCSQGAIEAKALERQFVDFLRTITLTDRLAELLLLGLDSLAVRSHEMEAARVQSLRNSVRAVDGELMELTKLRLRALLSDQEFVQVRQRLQGERLRLQEALEQADKSPMLAPFRELVSFSRYAADLFEVSDAREKRLILNAVGSHPILKDKKLSIYAVKPFELISDLQACPSLLTTLDHVRTFAPDGVEADPALEGLCTFASLPETEHALRIIRGLKGYRGVRSVHGASATEDGKGRSIGPSSPRLESV
jgi:site-specific DNA recombinase